jgi:hypothetical protein
MDILDTDAGAEMLGDPLQDWYFEPTSEGIQR